MSTRVLCAAVVALAAVTVTAAIAQVAGTATLVGTVTDTTGAVLPGVRVNVVNTATSFRSETTTSPEGSYYIPYLSPGTYQISFEASGFKRYVRDGFVVRTAEMPRVDIMLEVGSVEERVTVSAVAP